MSISRLPNPRIQTSRGKAADGLMAPLLRLACPFLQARRRTMAESIQEKTVEKTEKRDKPEPADQIAITRHRAKIGRREIAYTVTCGTLVLKEEAEKEGKSEGEKARAKVFFIAYTLDDTADK